MFNKINLISVVIISIISTYGLAESRHENSILITDINEKLSMGFEPEDTLYRINNLNSENYNADKEFNETRGFSSPKRVGYLGVESQGRTSQFQYSTGAGYGDIYRSSGTDAFTDILLELDDASDFNFVRIWGYDSNVVEDMTFFLFERCLPAFSGGPVTSTQLGTVDSSTSAGNFSVLINIAADAITVDNTSCTYTLRTRFDTTNSTLRLFKVRAEMILAI